MGILPSRFDGRFNVDPELPLQRVSTGVGSSLTAVGRRATLEAITKDEAKAQLDLSTKMLDAWEAMGGPSGSLDDLMRMMSE
jgi:hypothetical protein